jgi:hypothetical protein
MKTTAIIVFIMLACLSALLFRLKRFRATRTGWWLRGIWFAIVMTLFFFYRSHFTVTQIIFMVFVGIAGVIYFFFEYRKITKQ